MKGLRVFKSIAESNRYHAKREKSYRDFQMARKKELERIDNLYEEKKRTGAIRNPRNVFTHKAIRLERRGDKKGLNQLRRMLINLIQKNAYKSDPEGYFDERKRAKAMRQALYYIKNR